MKGFGGFIGGGCVFVVGFCLFFGCFFGFVFLLLKDVELLVQRFHIQADIYRHKKPCSVYFCICRALLSFS